MQDYDEFIAESHSEVDQDLLINQVRLFDTGQVSSKLKVKAEADDVSSFQEMCGANNLFANEE